MAETIVVAAAASVRGKIGFREREVADKLALLRRWIIQFRNLGRAQPLSLSHSCLLVGDAGRPSDPGQGVD
jgi:hypothetical protein